MPCYFYPRSPCGERRTRPPAGGMKPRISIHALLAESDPAHQVQVVAVQNFYPRSPCGERRQDTGKWPWPSQFLSTLSLRRATNDAINGCNPDFISIHALLAESDITEMRLALDDIKFLSTLSLRRATHGPGSYARVCGISIHALLAESDISTEAMTHDI